MFQSDPNDDFYVPEIKIGVHEFSVFDSKIHLIMVSGYREIVDGFFRKITEGGDWETEKKAALFESFKVDRPGDASLEEFEKILERYPNYFRLYPVFSDMEKNQNLMALVLESKRDSKIDDLLNG